MSEPDVDLNLNVNPTFDINVDAQIADPSFRRTWFSKVNVNVHGGVQVQVQVNVNVFLSRVYD
jgi:hypothetical protein